MSVNGRVRPDWVVVDVKTGREQRISGGTYYLDWTEPDGGKGGDGKGKRMRVAVGTSAVTAQNARLRKEAELKALARGIALVPSEDGAKRSLPLAVEDFLEQVKLTRKEKTHEGYRIALGYFQASCSKRYVEDIEKLDLLKFMAFLRDEKKQAPRSVANKFACVSTFLTEHGIAKLVGKKDRPRFVDEQVEIYEHGELDKLLRVCTPYHRTLYDFLLMTGLREKEAMFCQWDDVNLSAGTVNVRWKAEYGFDPKGYKEREVPIPSKLVAILKKFKPKDAKGNELVFHTESGRPDTHMLRALKRNVGKAGLNRDDFYLHKFRATFATAHLAAGVDLRTVQQFLGHTNLESTIRYLKPARSESIRDKVNATFG